MELENIQFILKNEFAFVEITVDVHSNSPKLCIKDRMSGKVRCFDALELECLTRISPEIFDEYLPY